MKKTILEVPFWKVALRFSLLFLGVTSMIFALTHYMLYKNFSAVSQSLEAGTWSDFCQPKYCLRCCLWHLNDLFFSEKRKEKKQEVLTVPFFTKPTQQIGNRKTYESFTPQTLYRRN